MDSRPLRRALPRLAVGALLALMCSSAVASPAGARPPPAGNAIAWGAAPHEVREDARDSILTHDQLAHALSTSSQPVYEALPATAFNVNFTAILSNVKLPNISNINLPPLSTDALAEAFDVNKTKNLGGLEVWSGLGQSWRAGVRGQQPLSQAAVKDGSIDPANPELQKIILPVLIFAGICIVAGILTLLSSPITACCAVYRKPSGLAQRRLADGSNKKGFLRLKIAFIVLAFLQLIFVICMTQGNAALSRGISTSVGAVQNTAEAAYAITYNLQPVANGIISGTSAVINSTIDDITAPTTVPAFEASIKTAGDALSSILRAAAGQVTGAKSDLDALDASLSTTTGNVNTVKSDLNNALSGANNLNAQLTVPNTNEGYRLTNQISGIPTASSFGIPDLSSPPSTSQARNQVNGLPDLAAQANNVDAQVASAGATVRTKLAEANTAVKGNVQPLINQATTLINGLADVKKSGSVAFALNSALDTVQAQVTAQSQPVKGYLTIAYYVVLAIAIVLILGFLAVGLSLPTTSPKPPRHCACLTLLLAGLLFLLAGVLFIGSVGVGEACTQLDPVNPAPSAGAFFPPSTNVTAIAKMGLGTLNTCASSSNVSVLMALELNGAPAVLGLGAGVSLNLTKLTDSQLASLDLAKQVNDQLNSLNVASLVSWNGGSVSDQLAPLTGTAGPLASFNFGFFSTLPTAISTSSLVSLRDNLSSLKGSVDTNSFTYDTTVVTAQQKTNCVNDFKSRLDTQISALNNIINTSAPNAAAALADTKTKGGNLETRVTQLKTSANTIVTRFNALVGVATDYLAATRTDLTTVRIPKATKSLIETAGTVDATIAARLSCQPLARSLLATTNGVCVVTQSGLDALWLACFWAAVVAEITVGIFVKLHAYLRAARDAPAAPGTVPAGKAPISGKDALKVNPASDAFSKANIIQSNPMSPGAKV
ncbi:hypothetical protein H9P43_005326 [Blastocladiella emersonii ATCC 22665]|nr:hypothetical protein H9P43_005326 [Blastocladiella emersonii ATCC 22665]